MKGFNIKLLEYILASQKMYNPEVNFFQKAPTSAENLENG